MIEELITQIVDTLKANDTLKDMYWHYGEPTRFDHSERGEGYVSIVPIEPSSFMAVTFATDRLELQLFIVIAYRHLNEEDCDKWVHNKVETVWQIIKDNPTWNNLAIETHLLSCTFFPSTENDWTFDKMYTRFSVHLDINPSS